MEIPPEWCNSRRKAEQTGAVSGMLWITTTTQREETDAVLFKELGQHALQRLMEMEAEQKVRTDSFQVCRIKDRL